MPTYLIEQNRREFQSNSVELNRFLGRDPFNQNSNRSDREKWSTSKGGPVFSKLFRLKRTDPLSFGLKFPEILVEWIAIAPLNSIDFDNRINRIWNSFLVRLSNSQSIYDHGQSCLKPVNSVHLAGDLFIKSGTASLNYAQYKSLKFLGRP